MRFVRLLPLSLLLVAAPASAQNVEAGFPRTAFLFEARLALGDSTPVTNTGGGNIGGVGFSAVPSLLAGARLIDRLHLGLGFSFARVSNGGGAANVVTFAPTFAIDIWKAHDDRVAFYGKAALPLGPAVQTGQNFTDTGFAVGFDFALGVRYAFHRAFSFGFEAGTSGAYLNPQRDNTLGVVTVYGALVGSFMAGH